MFRTSLLLPIAALLLLLILVVSAPARVLMVMLPSGQVQLAGVRGSLWSGSASRAVLFTDAGPLQLGAVEWTLRPWSLLRLAPTLELSSRWGSQAGAAVLSLRGRQAVDLAEVDVQVDASLLRQLAPVAVDGRFVLLAPRLELRKGLPVGGQGRLLWQNAAWLAPDGRQPLGSYAFDFSEAEGSRGLDGEISTVSGPLRVSGLLGLEQRNYSVDVSIGSEGGLDPRLAQALSLMAVPQNGAYRLKLSGSLENAP